MAWMKEVTAGIRIQYKRRTIEGKVSTTKICKKNKYKARWAKDTY